MSDWNNLSLFEPNPEHKALREMVADFIEREVEGQAAQFDKKEEFNLDLFRKLGSLGLFRFIS